jgi:sodium/bile acid cotransporter 7
MILAPLLLGNALRLTRLRDFAESNAAALRLLNTSVILFIVLTAFSNAVQNDILQEQTPAAITMALLVSLLFFVISTGITRGLGGLFLRDAKDRLAICFSAPQKSMATGIPMIVVMIGDPSRVGALILPVLIYHQIQLLLGGFLASKLHHES